MAPLNANAAVLTDTRNQSVTWRSKSGYTDDVQ
jgi:hypothetical protein